MTRHNFHIVNGKVQQFRQNKVDFALLHATVFVEDDDILVRCGTGKDDCGLSQRINFDKLSIGVGQLLTYKISVAICNIDQFHGRTPLT